MEIYFIEVKLAFQVVGERFFIDSIMQTIQSGRSVFIGYGDFFSELTIGIYRVITVEFAFGDVRNRDEKLAIHYAENVHARSGVGVGNV